MSTCTSCWLQVTQHPAGAWENPGDPQLADTMLFFYPSALQAQTPGLISRRWCGFCWLSICCFPIFREKGNPQRIFLLTLKFLQSLHCFSLFLLGVKVLMSDVSFFSFFSHTYSNHLGGFGTQFNIIVTTALVLLHVILAEQISLPWWHGFGQTAQKSKW